MKRALPLLVVLLGSGCATKVKIDPGDGGSLSTSSDEPSASSGLGSLTGAGGEGTTGKPCSATSDCDPNGNGLAICLGIGDDDVYPYPDPVCVHVGHCTLGQGSVLAPCDKGTGVCIPDTEEGGGDCVPRCAFDDSGAPPTGCVGKDACMALGYTVDVDGKNIAGIGKCYGGCGFEDCMNENDNCDVVSGLCFNQESGESYSDTMLGAACTDFDSNGGCFCLNKPGECTKFCRMGDANGCPTGFECDSRLPNSTDISLTTPPVGLGGYCYRDCTSDSDCPNGTCEQGPWTTQKTCHVAAKP